MEVVPINRRMIIVNRPDLRKNIFKVKLPTESTQPDKIVRITGETSGKLLEIAAERWNQHLIEALMFPTIEEAEAIYQIYGITKTPTTDIRKLRDQIRRYNRYRGYLMAMPSRLNEHLKPQGWIMGMSNIPTGVLKLGFQEIPLLS